ncbi:MAG: hypothetical protein ACYCYK_05780 [Candidatus Dormibacteria bacterium]
MRGSFSGWLAVGLLITGGVLAGVVQGAPTVLAASGGSAYRPVTPVRLLDTRTQGGALTAGANRNLQVADTTQVPAGATAVVVNLTATATSSAGYLTVYPTGLAVPLASNLNWERGQTVANLAVVPVGNGYSITIHNATGSAEVLVDLQGYFAPVGSGLGYYVPLTPARIADTRPQSGEPDAGMTLASNSPLGIQVAGMGGVPATGATAAVLNVTATDTSSAGFLSVYPAGPAWPGTSSLNWAAGGTVADRVIVPLGAGGKIAVYTNSGPAQVVVDVTGYFTTSATAASASLFYPVTPRRMLDTRADGGTLRAGQPLVEQLGGVGSIANQASAVVANLTATRTSAASFLSASPVASAPSTSDLNWSAGATTANLDIATLSRNGDLALYNSSGTADVILDVSGYFVPTGTTSAAPAICSGLSVAVTNVPTLGGRIDVSAGASCPSGVTPGYTFWYQVPGSAVWQVGSASAGTPSSGYSGRTLSVGTYRVLVWASSQGGAFQGLVAGASATLTANPSTNLTANPSTNLPDSFAGTCYNQGYASGACVADALAAIGAAQVVEGVPALKLPPDFASLSQPIQEFVLADAERVSRGLPAIAGLTGAANSNAAQGASQSADPYGLGVPGAIAFASIWAEDYGAAAAAFDWMYNDGPGSNNVDCTTAGAPGCWGHRDNILLNTASGAWAPPGGYTWVGGAACVPASGVSYFNSCTMEWVLVPTGSVAYQYTWAQAVAAGA